MLALLIALFVHFIAMLCCQNDEPYQKSCTAFEYTICRNDILRNCDFIAWTHVTWMRHGRLYENKA